MRLNKCLFILSVFLLQLNTSKAQSNLNGFLGIPFGTNMETAKRIMLQKEGVIFVRFIKDDFMSAYRFIGVKIGKYIADSCLIMECPLVKNKFASGVLSFHNRTEIFYNDIYELICNKYGKPTHNSIYKGINETIWEFSVKESTVKNSISLTKIEQDNRFDLSYSGGGICDLEFYKQYKEQKQKEFKGF